MDPLVGGLIGGGFNILGSWINHDVNAANAATAGVNAQATLEGVKNQGTALVVNQNTAKIQAEQNKTLAMYALLAVGVATLGFVAYGLVVK